MFVVIVGSKGGVGSTTLTAALVEAAGVGVKPVDLTGGMDLAYAHGAQGAQLDELARMPDTALELAVKLATTHKGVLSLSETGRLLYAARVARLLEQVEAAVSLVVDAGVAPLPAMLDLADVILVVMTPDPRSLRRAERFVQAQGGLAERVVGVLNQARAGTQTAAWPLPDTGRVNPLRDEAWRQAVAGLASHLGLIEALAETAQAGAPHPKRPGRSFDLKKMLPSVKLVD